jgi:hypothetical protein
MHPALRTAYVESDGVPVQRELPYEAVEHLIDIEVRDLSGEEDPLGCAARLHQELYRTRFDLASPPNFRVGVWKTAASTWVVSWTVFHIVTDWWAVDILRRDAARLYAAMRCGADASSVPRTVPLPTGAGIEFDASDEEYWLTKFSSLPREVNVTRKRRPLIKSYAGGLYLQTLADVSFAQADSARERLGVTMASLTFATFCLVLAALSNESDITVGVPFLNRLHPQVQDAVGLFVNSLPVRIHSAGRMTVSEFVKHCHAELVQAFRHGRYPSRRIYQSIKAPIRLSRSPLYEHLFTYYENTVSEARHDALDLRVRHLELPRGTSKYDLSMFVVRDNEQLNCKCEFASALWSQAEIAQFVATYQAALKSIIRDTDRPIDQLITDLQEPGLSSMFNVATINEMPVAAGGVEG